MEKKILYINKKDVDKVKGMHTLALLRKVKILSAPPDFDGGRGGVKYTSGGS